MAEPRIDIKQHVTDTIIAQIEAGTPPWRKPWTGDAPGISMPLRHNGESYRGINILMLWATAMEKGYISPRWMTFKQALDLGGSIRKGEKATKSVFYGTFERHNDKGQRSDEDEKNRVAFAKTNNVFNADQIDGLPENYYVQPEPPRDLGTKSDPDLDAFFAATNVEIVTTDEPRAYYSIDKDHIHMPPIETFYCASRFYSVLAHETCHASGSERRLGRLKPFAIQEEYAFEELVAEIGASILAVHLGYKPHFDQSAAYIEHWLKAMRAKKNMIFNAAAEAQKAVDYIIAQQAAGSAEAA